MPPRQFQTQVANIQEHNKGWRDYGPSRQRLHIPRVCLRVWRGRWEKVWVEKNEQMGEKWKGRAMGINFSS